MARFEKADSPVGFYAATMAIINCLIDQGAVDRGKLVVSIEAIVADLSPDERESTYGIALEHSLQMFERLQPFPNIPKDE